MLLVREKITIQSVVCSECEMLLHHPTIEDGKLNHLNLGTACTAKRSRVLKVNGMPLACSNEDVTGDFQN